jgi:hypothetical protein
VGNFWLSLKRKRDRILAKQWELLIPMELEDLVA